MIVVDTSSSALRPRLNPMEHHLGLRIIRTNLGNLPPHGAGAPQTTYGGVFDAFVGELAFAIPFASFTRKLDVTISTGSFDLDSSFRLGAQTGGFDPIANAVTLQMGLIH